jgi:MarR family transcriptional repressor of mepA
MKPVWEVMTNALNDITNNQNNLLQAINEAENKIMHQSFLQRALQLKSEGEK